MEIKHVLRFTCHLDHLAIASTCYHYQPVYHVSCMYFSMWVCVSDSMVLANTPECTWETFAHLPTVPVLNPIPSHICATLCVPCLSQYFIYPFANWKNGPSTIDSYEKFYSDDFRDVRILYFYYPPAVADCRVFKTVELNCECPPSPFSGWQTLMYMQVLF